MKRIYVLITLLFYTSINLFAQTKTPVKTQPKTSQQTKPQPKAQSVTPKDTFVEIVTEYGNIILRLYKETPLHRSNFIKLVQHEFYDSLLFHRIIKDFMIQGGDPISKHADSTTDVLGGGDVGYRIPAEFNPKLFHKRGALAAARDNNPEKASSGCQFYIVQGKKFNTQEYSNALNGANYNNKITLLNDVIQRDTVAAQMEDFTIRGDDEGRNRYMEKIQQYVEAEYKTIELQPDPFKMAIYAREGGAPHLDMNYTVFGEVVYGMEVVDKIASQSVNQIARPLKDIRMKAHIIVK